MEEIIVKLDGKEYKVNIEEREGGKLTVHFDGQSYEVEANSSKEVEEIIDTKKQAISGKLIVKSPLPGTVVSVNVKNGSEVTPGTSLVKLVAMKMENDIVADRIGVVKEVRVKKGESVNKDDVLVVIE